MQVIYSLYWQQSGQVYIGKTNSLKARTNSHFQKLRNASHYNTKLQEQFNLYGEPETVILEYCEDLEVFKREAVWITEFDAVNNGLNLRGDLRDNIFIPQEHAVPKPIKEAKYIVIDENNTLYYIDCLTEFCKTYPKFDPKNYKAEAHQLSKVLSLKSTTRSHKGLRIYTGTTTTLVQSSRVYTIKYKDEVYQGVRNLAEFARNHYAISDKWYNAANGLRSVARGTLKQYCGFYVNQSTTS